MTTMMTKMIVLDEEVMAKKLEPSMEPVLFAQHVCFQLGFHVL
jgi:hypothetical protein